MMKFAYNLSTVRIITPGVQTDISLRATNSEGNSNYSNSVTVTIPEPSDPGLPTGVLIGIIVGASVFAFIVLFIIIVLCKFLLYYKVESIIINPCRLLLSFEA